MSLIQQWVIIESEVRTSLAWQAWYLERFSDFRGRLANEWAIQCYEQHLACIEIRQLRGR